jgi:DNA-binding NarL/FixJ family response regulator
MSDREPGQVHLDNRCVLSDREAQVVRLLLTGYRVPEIGTQLFLSQSTVRNHLSSVFRKLRVNSQQELTLLFHELWREEASRPTGLGTQDLRHPRPLCAACCMPWWR